ncbi:hypothetical protein D3C85_1445240 [compost metagenome]
MLLAVPQGHVWGHRLPVESFGQHEAVELLLHMLGPRRELLRIRGPGHEALLVLLLGEHGMALEYYAACVAAVTLGDPPVG